MSVSEEEEEILVCLPTFMVGEVHVVGCGGTGGRLIPLVTQFMSKVVDNPSKILHLWDADVVEEKNLSRQNFVPSDVGKYKSAVLANRYGSAFGLPVVPHTEHLVKSNLSPKVWDVYFLCVDTMDARLDILEGLQDSLRWPGCLVIDCGNAATFGQVVLSTPMRDILKHLKKKPFYDQQTGLTDLECAPVPHNVYTRTTGSHEHISCGDMDQSMAINFMIAAGAFSMFQNWHHGNPVQNQVVYYSLDGFTARPQTIGQTVAEWSSYSSTVKQKV